MEIEYLPCSTLSPKPLPYVICKRGLGKCMKIDRFDLIDNTYFKQLKFIYIILYWILCW